MRKKFAGKKQIEFFLMGKELRVGRTERSGKGRRQKKLAHVMGTHPFSTISVVIVSYKHALTDKTMDRHSAENNGKQCERQLSGRRPLLLSVQHLRSLSA